MPGVTVNFDPTATPSFTFTPDPVHVPNGTTQTITWTLVSPNAPGAAFAATNGVYFKDTSNWGGSAPSSPGNSTNVYTVSDTNNNQGTTEIDYPYGVNVVYNNQTYNWDPEVANDPRRGAVKFLAR